MNLKLEEVFTILQDVPEYELKSERFLQHKESFIVEKEFYIYVFLIAVGFTIARYYFNNIISAILKQNGIKNLTITKYQEGLWQFCYYSFSSCICIKAALSLPYFWRPWRCFELPFPQHTVEPIEFWIYTLSTGWYFHQLYAHVMIELVKKDYWEMLAHHIVTLTLLLGAYSSGYFRIGVLVIFHTDLCDVILHLVKLIKLSDQLLKWREITKNGFFALLPISWLIFRIVFLFDRVIWTTLYVPIHYGGWHNADFYIFFNILLLAIYALQIFWFYIIMKIAFIKVFHGKDLADIREDHDDTQSTKNGNGAKKNANGAKKNGTKIKTKKKE